jgi:hypothetical protein
MRTLPILAAATALVLAAAGCGASSATQQSPSSGPSAHPPAPIAHLTVRGVYARGPNPGVVGGDLKRGHFALTCYTAAGYRALHTARAWQRRLCGAILDYRTVPKRPNGVCACPAFAVHVSIQGSIRGRPVDLLLTPCICFDGKRRARDTRIVLRTHPRFA